jgi:hypothetical protein
MPGIQERFQALQKTAAIRNKKNKMNSGFPDASASKTRLVNLRQDSFIVTALW